MSRFEHLQKGDSFTFKVKVTAADVAAFAAVSGDHNPLHRDDGYARAAGFKSRVVHGMFLASQVSNLVGMRIPGPGSLWVMQTFRWRAPVFVEDTVSFTVRITHRSQATRTLALAVTASNQHEIVVMDGEGLVKLIDVIIPDEELTPTHVIAQTQDFGG